MPSPLPVGTVTPVVNSTAGTSCAPAIPTGLTNGQHWMLLVVSVSGNKSASITTPAGWAAITGSPFLNSASTETLAVYTKLFATGDTAPSVSWTSSNKNCGYIIAYKDADLVTLFDVTPASATGSSTTPTSPSVAAITRGATRIQIHGRAVNGTGTPSFDMVERVDIATTSTNPASCYHMDQAGMAEGATGSLVATTTTTGSWVAVTLWLRPAVPTTFGLLQSASFVDSTSASSYTKAFPNVLTSGSCLVVQAVCIHSAGATLNAPTYPGGTFTKVPSSEELSTNLDAATFTYQNNTNTTAATITQTLSGTADCAFLLTEWLGPATTGTLVDTQAAATGSTTAISATSGTTSSGTRLALMVFSVTNTETSFTMAAAYTQRWSQPSATFCSLGTETREFAGGSAETATATEVSTAAEWAASLVVLLPSSGVTTVALSATAPGRYGAFGLSQGATSARSPARAAAASLPQHTLSGTSPDRTGSAGMLHPAASAASPARTRGAGAAQGAMTARAPGRALAGMVGRVLASAAAPGHTSSRGLAQAPTRAAASAHSGTVSTAHGAAQATSPARSAGRAAPSPAISGRSPARAVTAGTPGPPALRGQSSGRSIAAGTLTSAQLVAMAGTAIGRSVARGLATVVSSGSSAGRGATRGTSSPAIQGTTASRTAARGAPAPAASGTAPTRTSARGTPGPAVRGTSPARVATRGAAAPTVQGTAPARTATRGTPGSPALRGTSSGRSAASGTLTSAQLMAMAGTAIGRSAARGLAHVLSAGSTAPRSAVQGTPGSPKLQGRSGGTSRARGTNQPAIAGTAPARTRASAGGGAALRGTSSGRALAQAAGLSRLFGKSVGQAVAQMILIIVSRPGTVTLTDRQVGSAAVSNRQVNSVTVSSTQRGSVVVTDRLI